MYICIVYGRSFCKNSFSGFHYFWAKITKPLLIKLTISFFIKLKSTSSNRRNSSLVHIKHCASNNEKPNFFRNEDFPITQRFREKPTRLNFYQNSNFFVLYPEVFNILTGKSPLVLLNRAFPWARNSTTLRNTFQNVKFLNSFDVVENDAFSTYNNDFPKNRVSKTVFIGEHFVSIIKVDWKDHSL